MTLRRNVTSEDTNLYTLPILKQLPP